MAALAGLDLTQPAWAWLALGAALLAVEAATGTGWLLWPAAAAGAVAVAVALAGLAAPVAILAFAGLTIVATVLARRWFPRRPRPGALDINDNIGRLVGRQGRTVSAFRGRQGRVFLDGKEWSAELQDGEALEPGAAVEVVGVDGARLKVKAV
jgi:membrane protein implicated in regulation of membrane protease activity